jgi:hypothetical protein
MARNPAAAVLFADGLVARSPRKTSITLAGGASSNEVI